jgi:hypothetical protein
VATTYTPHYNLAKPDRGSTNWDVELNANFETIDAMLYELELHTNATGNPHQTTYSDVGAAPVSHTHHGGDITGAVAEATNADTVDGLHFERYGNLLRFSSDGTTFVYAGDMVSADYDINGDKVVNAADYAAQAGNADTTDNYHANPNAVANTIAVRDASADLAARTFIATATHGTPPLTVQSQTVVQNLNADMVDGKHASELTRIITSDLTLNVPSQYSTIQAALNSIRDAFIPNNVYVTIQVASGTYTHTSQITISHPCGSQIKIVGANPVTTTLTGVGTITGSAGNWSVPLQVQSASGIAVGDFVIVRDTTGTGDHYALRGVWEVTGVSGNTVTVKNTHRKSSFPSFTVSGGTVVALKTILKFNGCSGIVVYDATLGYLNNVAIVGNLTSNTRGIAAGKTTETQVRESGGVVVCGSNVGMSSFANGLYTCSGTIFAQGVASSGNASSGFFAAYSGSIYASYATASGNSSYGFYAGLSGSINASYATASGNSSYGFYAVHSGSINASYATASGNNNHGFFAAYSGSIYASYATASGNSGHGFSATVSGSIYAHYAIASGNSSRGFYAALLGSIYAPYSTATGNSTDYMAEKMGYIHVSGYQGSPTFSPALNTVGNYNAIITT